MLEKRRHALPGVVTLEDLQEQVPLEVDPVDEGQVAALVDSPLTGPAGHPGAGRGGGGDGPSGDYNGDGQIDAADYTVYQDTVGQAVTAGSGADGNANGAIDQGDYIFWSDRFGNAAGSGGAAAVPEPSTLVLLPLLFAGLASVRRRAA